MEKSSLRSVVFASTSALLTVLISSSLHAQTQASCSFTYFKPPANYIYGFYPNGVNHYSTVVGGVFGPSQNVESAFIRQSNGKMSLYTVPGAAWTVLNRRNYYGTSVGAYGSASANQPPGMGSNGFILTANSRATLNYPGALSTTLGGINKSTAIVGSAVDAKTKGEFGFKYKQGTFTQIKYPGSVQTTANAINNYGVIVGGYEMGSFENPWQGYILKNGVFKSLKYIPGDINNSGVIVESNRIHYPDGTVKVVYVPGSANTWVSSINDLGIITGGASFGTFQFEGYTAKCQ